MSYKNLKLNFWTHPTSGELRVYIDTRYCDTRNGLAEANGCWLTCDKVTGGTSIHFKPSANGEGRCTALQNVFSMLVPNQKFDIYELYLALPFIELVARINQCVTKSGNFSYTKYEKLFIKDL